MEIIELNGKEYVIMPKEDFNEIKVKILAQRQLIDGLQKELEL